MFHFIMISFRRRVESNDVRSDENCEYECRTISPPPGQSPPGQSTPPPYYLFVISKPVSQRIPPPPPSQKKLVYEELINTLRCLIVGGEAVIFRFSIFFTTNSILLGPPILAIHFFLFISNLTQFEPSKLLKISIVLHCST